MSRRPWVLLNPGPVNVTPAVRRALLGPDICHREPEFSRLLSRVRGKLLGLFGAARTHRLALFSGSGTTALEAMMASFAHPRLRTLVLSNGVYGRRLAAALEVRGLPVRVLESPLGSFPSTRQIEIELRRPSVHAVAMVHHETSTGMLNPLHAVKRLARKHRKFLLVDAISSLGAETLELGGIDLLAGTSGKCLHGFPGISFVFVSRRAERELARRPKRSLYLDLGEALRQTGRGETSFTPAVQVLYALDAALDALSRGSLKARIADYRRKSGLLWNGLERLGVRALLPPAARSHVLAAFHTPEGSSYRALHDRLKKSGFVIYAGQSSLEGRIFRVANLGEVSMTDLRRFLKSFASALRGRKARG